MPENPERIIGVVGDVDWLHDRFSNLCVIAISLGVEYQRVLLGVQRARAVWSKAI